MHMAHVEQCQTSVRLAIVSDTQIWPATCVIEFNRCDSLCTGTMCCTHVVTLPISDILMTVKVHPKLNVI